MHICRKRRRVERGLAAIVTAVFGLALASAAFAQQPTSPNGTKMERGVIKKKVPAESRSPVSRSKPRAAASTRPQAGGSRSTVATTEPAAAVDSGGGGY